MLILPEWFVYRANLQQAYTHALHIIRQALSLPSAVGASTWLQYLSIVRWFRRFSAKDMHPNQYWPVRYYRVWVVNTYLTCVILMMLTAAVVSPNKAHQRDSGPWNTCRIINVAFAYECLRTRSPSLSEQATHDKRIVDSISAVTRRERRRFHANALNMYCCYSTTHSHLLNRVDQTRGEYRDT